MLEYRAAYFKDPESSWYVAQVLDFPGALSQGRDLDHARRMLAHSLQEMIEWYLEDGLPLPKPNPSMTDSTAFIVEPIRVKIRARSGEST
jgi:predicted RNase H-like HicB family nuclease